MACLLPAPPLTRLGAVPAAAPAPQNWLYDEGEDEAKSVYVAKLAELKKAGDAIELRASEDAARPGAVAALRAMCEGFLAAARRGEAKYAHIEQVRRQGSQRGEGRGATGQEAPGLGVISCGEGV